MSRIQIGAAALIILHIVGAVGTLLPATSEQTISLTPYNLIISCAVLIYFHKGDDILFWRFFVISLLAGYFIEVIGVHTGWPFGDYEYGPVLGVQWFDVPLTIGLNWFMLSYAFAMVVNQFIKKSPLIKSAFGATLMVALDFLIEPVAIKLNYWTWTNETIPFSNFLAWWVISFLLQLILTLKGSQMRNPLALILLLAQSIYFAAIFFL